MTRASVLHTVVAFSLIASPLSGCGVVYSYLNNEDKLDERLSVPMQKQEVLDALGKPDKVLRDDGRLIMWQYRLYSRYQWVQEIALCPFTFYLGGCFFYPAGYLRTYDDSYPYHFYVVLLDDQLCMWGSPEVVETRKTCKQTVLAKTQKSGSTSSAGNAASSRPVVAPVLFPPRITIPFHRIAVVPLSDIGSQPKAANWIDLTLNLLRSRHPQMVLVERDALNPVMAEQLLQLSGRIDEQTVTRVGRMTGAEVLLTYRVEPLQSDALTSIASNGGSLLGTVEFRLIHVEQAVTLFRQVATASVTLTAPGPGRAWPEVSIRQTYRNAVDDAAAYGLASLVAAFGDNPLGLVPDLYATKEGISVYGLLQGSPGHVAGLRAGDRIVATNGQRAVTWTEPLTLPVALTIDRGGDAQTISVGLSRSDGP